MKVVLIIFIVLAALALATVAVAAAICLLPVYLFYKLFHFLIAECTGHNKRQEAIRQLQKKTKQKDDSMMSTIFSMISKAKSKKVPTSNPLDKDGKEDTRKP